MALNNELYTAHANVYDRHGSSSSFNSLYEQPTMLKLIGGVIGKSVLDLGCGPGFYSYYLIRAGAARLTAVDRSKEMVEIAKRRLSNVSDIKVNFDMSDMKMLALGEERFKCYDQDLSKGLPNEGDCGFDRVVAPLVLHYIADISSVFREVYRVLKPGGLFLFSSHHPFFDWTENDMNCYYDVETINDTWDINNGELKDCKVSYYRRPISDFFNSLIETGFQLEQVVEKPQLDDRMRESDPKAFANLSRQPAFFFVKSSKPILQSPKLQ
eukprot:Selendium_serpulae@DN4831_c0_g1_i2.p1